MWNRKNHEAGNEKIDKNFWFEWWYYKVVLSETGESFYFVYGVVNPWDLDEVNPESRSYAGFGNFGEKEIVEMDYPVSDFNASYESTDIWVKDNHATDRSIDGFLIDEDGEVTSWDIKIDYEWGYNAMGWSMPVYGITNIFWYPVQTDAYFTGEIFHKGRTYKLEKAPGYQDRNWGNSFPEWWTWIVSNNFEGYPETSLAIGGGRPEIFNAFDPIEGVAIGLKHKGKEYIFRINDLNSIAVNISFGTWIVDANDSRYRVTVTAHAPAENFMDLQFVTPQGEIFHDYETLVGTLELNLYKRSVLGWKLIDRLNSSHAGIEYGSRNTYEFGRLFAGETVLIDK